MSENPNPETPTEGDEGKQEQTFTQADVDRIVRERVKRERDKFADYDDLKAKAGEKQTVEEQLAELREQLTSTKIVAARASVAARFGISTERGKNDEPSDADLFLTGTDEETLTAQAKRLADRESERKQNGNHVPREGNNPSSSNDGEERAFVRQLFADVE